MLSILASATKLVFTSALTRLLFILPLPPPAACYLGVAILFEVEMMASSSCCIMSWVVFFLTYLPAALFAFEEAI